MPTPELGAAQVARVIRRVRESDPSARRIGIRHTGTWKGGDVVREGEDDFRVVLCKSPLAVRAALVDAGDHPVVVLTPADPKELGLDVLARLASRRLQSVERFEALKSAFGAVKADPRLGRLGWLADELVSEAPDEGYPVPRNGYLDLDRAWQAFFRKLGIDSPRPDLRALLDACLRGDRIKDWKSWPEEVRAGATARIVEGAGEVGRLALAALESEKPLHPVALGLVCRVLHSAAQDDDGLELKQAAVRLEPSLSGQVLGHAVAEEWAQAAESAVTAAPAESKAVLQAAQKLLEELKVPHHAWRSRLIPSGFDQRVGRFVREVQDVLEGPARLDGLLAAARAVGEHSIAGTDAGKRRRRAVEMAARLVRWLTSRASAAAPAGAFHAAVDAYAAELSFVDQAREELAVGEANADAAKAYARLAAECLTRRERVSRQFAERLASWSESPADGGGLLRVEGVLRDVVAPLAKEHPVLLLVMDGMSYGVFRCFLDDVVARGWVELAREPEGKRLSAIAALPSVTEVSRASLLCGMLRAGLAADEKKGFETHAGLKEASKRGKAPVLFHKADLSEGGGYGLAEDLAGALGTDGPRVVGLVVNAVDDHLAKGDQSAPRWGVAAVTPLEAVLETALAAGRTVVMTADHGHVAERGTSLRSHADEGERHRRPVGAVEEGELLVRGPRVVFSGGAVVLPWSERIRYGKKKNGYHGGASPQEVVVPLAVFAPSDSSHSGWREMSPEAPDWWDLEATGAQPPRQVPKTATRAATRNEPAQPSLFAPPQVSLVDRLFASERWKLQLQVAGRVRPSDDLARGVIEALLASQGTLTSSALAKRLSSSVASLSTKLTAMRKVLNVEGYLVLEVDDAAQTVRLNEPLLVEQFGLEKR